MAGEKTTLNIANIYYEFASCTIEICTSVYTKNSSSPEATNSTDLYTVNNILNKSLQTLHTACC